MRVHAVLRLLRGVEPRALLEVGCGRGDLLVRLSKIGWEGSALEPGAEAATVARRAVATAGRRFRIVCDEAEVTGTYDVVLALEVLEHLPDDAAALRRWREWVRPGGILVLSVPAHPEFWSLSDEIGGHLRRYERNGLRTLVEAAGFSIERFWSVGFPVTAITRRFRNTVSRRRHRELDGVPREARVLQSSFDSVRRSPLDAAVRIVEGPIGATLHALQLPFLNTDLGAGYALRCRRVV